MYNVYVYLHLVQDFIRRQVGCQHAWDEETDLPICKEIQALRDYENVSRTLSRLGIESLVGVTGCNTPCKFTKYSQAKAVPQIFKRFASVAVSLNILEMFQTQCDPSVRRPGRQQDDEEDRGPDVPAGVLHLRVWWGSRIVYRIFLHDDLGSFGAYFDNCIKYSKMFWKI